MLYEPQSEKEWKQLIGTNFKNSFLYLKDDIVKFIWDNNTKYVFLLNIMLDNL